MQTLPIVNFYKHMPCIVYFFKCWLYVFGLLGLTFYV